MIPKDIVQDIEEKESRFLHRDLIYRHIKSGKEYHVGKVAINCTNGDSDGKQMVIYCDDVAPPNFYVREINEFCEKFEKVS